MVDPISAAVASAPTWLPWVIGGAGAGAAGASLMSGGKTAQPEQPKVPAPPGLVPAQAPGAKPGKKGMQSSFLSGAAMAQQSAQSQTPGKSLLGA